MVIVATKDGAEIRELLFSEYDIEVGDEDNSFAFTCLRGEWEDIPKDARIYIPGTEYGGFFRELKTDTAQDTITPGGLTWRGMLQKKIIEPEAGEDYAIDSGELNAIIKKRVEAAFPGVFYGVETDTGITARFQYNRYCTLYDGLSALLKSKGYKLRIEYDGTVTVRAVPIVDYSRTIEFSSNQRANYVMQSQSDGVNHLICLGAGELAARTVIHLYCNSRGTISMTQSLFGVDEIAAVYDNPGSSYTDLRSGGIQRLRELRSKNQFDIKLDTGEEYEIGDIVGGRDYLSGMTLAAPIIGKVVKWSGGLQTIDYTLGEVGEV